MVQSIFADNSDHFVVPSKLVFYFWKVFVESLLMIDVEIPRIA